jgi:hypothetical protein
MFSVQIEEGSDLLTSEVAYAMKVGRRTVLASAGKERRQTPLRYDGGVKIAVPTP